MLTMKEFMEKVGVTKQAYVLEWIDRKLIPGVQKEGDTYLFPDSARRPYRSRCKPNCSAKIIRGAIVNACLKRQHISASTFCLSDGEFESYVDDLIKAELIISRKEDGIYYYDSTLKSEQFSELGVEKIAKQVHKCICAIEPALSIAASAMAIGTATGLL